MFSKWQIRGFVCVEKQINMLDNIWSAYELPV